MKKIFVFLLFVFMFSSISIYVIYFSKYVMPWNKEETIITTLKWGDLKAIPEKAEILNIEKHGSIFTKQYIIEFKSNRDDIKSWIENSKRLKNNTPKNIMNKRVFEIFPREQESIGGRVEIENNIVRINMSWS